MKTNLLLLSVLGSLLLWLGAAHAAAPRYNSWGDWQNSDVPTEAVKDDADKAKSKANEETSKPKGSSDKSVAKKASAKQTAASKPTTSRTPTDKAVKPGKIYKPSVAEVSHVEDEPVSLGPPTKGRRISSSSEEDRRMPTPSPKIIVTQGKRGDANEEEANLSWWERWKRKREGIPLKKIIIPESHVYSVRLQEGQWTVASSRLECKLSQTVPHLGKVMFQQKVGTELEFKMELDRSYEQIHAARFESMPATWGHQTHQQAMVLPVSIQKASLTVSREGAVRLINELLEGMAPRMTYRMGDSESSDEVVVTLSARTFVDKLQAFQHCIDNLLPYQFDQVKESVVYFNYDKATLTDKAKKALAKVADYVKLDDKVKRISIEGYTDSKGFRRYNYRLATLRAKAVEQFFLDQGISKARISMRSQAYGEKKPVASNKSAEGRAQNRRVHVSLFK